MRQDEPQKLREVALLVRHVPSAISDVISVRQDETLADAQTRMSANEFSQLAVISSSGRLVGAVSWRSIAQRHLSKAEIYHCGHAAQAIWILADEGPEEL